MPASLAGADEQQAGYEPADRPARSGVRDAGEQRRVAGGQSARTDSDQAAAMTQGER